MIIYKGLSRRPPLPDVGQEVLVKAGVDEDLLDLQAADEAVHVGVRLQEDVVVATTLRHGDHPVHRVLRGGGKGRVSHFL